MFIWRREQSRTKPLISRFRTRLNLFTQNTFVYRFRKFVSLKRYTMKRGKQLKIKQLKVIICAWLIMGFLITVYDHLILLTSNSLGLSEDYSFLISMARNMGAGLIGALIGGSILVFYVNVKYQDKPYGYTIAVVCISFILIVAFISVLMGVILVPLRTGKSLSDPVSGAAFQSFMLDSSHIKAAISWSFVVAITQLLLQVNSKFGQGVFWNITRGRYNTPKEEKSFFCSLILILLPLLPSS